MTVSVSEAARRAPFTRLVHFTPAINLLPIFRDGMLRSSKDLAENAALQLAPTDKFRIDAHPEHLCCTFEYPNAYYRDTASKKQEFVNYPDWVHFILSRDLALRDGALFAPCNAANAGGRYLRPGGQALLDCWASPSIPKGILRKGTQNPGVPTDLQSEVLIPAPVTLANVTAVVVHNADKARELYAFLDGQAVNPGQVEWRYASVLYDKIALRDLIWRGSRISENTWTPKDGE